MQYQVIKCSPKYYQGLLLKFSDGISKFTYKVNPMMFTVRDQFLIVYDARSKCYKIINKAATKNPVVLVSLEKFNLLEIQFTSTNLPKYLRYFTWNVLKGKSYTINVESNVSFNKGGRNKVITQSAQQRVVTNVEKQSVTKPFWKKHSDATRSKFSRLWRYNELAGVYTDSRLRGSYRSKFVMAKFLSWKFGLSLQDLAKIGKNNSLSNKLLVSLATILLLIGVYSNVTNVKSDLTKGIILVNGQVVTDFLHPVKIGDVIWLCQSKQQKPSSITKFAEAYPGDVFIIKQLPVIEDLQLLQLNKAVKDSVSGKLLNPMNTVFNRGNSWVNRLFKV